LHAPERITRDVSDLRSDAGERRAAPALVVLLVAAALAFVAVRAPVLSLPLERDEGEYAYVAWRVLEGELPYRDAFDQKPPGVFAAYVLAFLLLGRSLEAIHLFAWAWTLATAALLFALVRRLAGGLAAGFALLVFAVLSGHPALLATAANTEIFMLLPLTASLLALERALAGDRAGPWLACGALAAAGCWLKQVAALHALFLAAAALTSLPRTGRPRALARRLVALAAGAVLVSAPVLGLFAAAGGLAAFADAVLFHNFAYVGSVPAAVGLAQLRHALALQAPALGVAWLLAAAALLVPGWLSLRGRGLLGGWLAASLCAAAVGLHFRPHYFVQALPPLAALTGVAASRLLQLARARAAARAGGAAPAAAAWLALAALALALVAPPVLAARHTLFAGSPEAVSRAIYGLNPFPESLAIARHIARTSAPDERVYVVGSEPQILFYAERRSATRYIYFYPLTGAYADALERQREALAEVERSRPRYIVWVSLPTSLALSEASERWILEASEALLRRDYALELVVRPDAAGTGYELEYGGAGAAWLRRQRGRLEALPWLAVYRRLG
jgi:4-amino-4-deoxy-L-arabinose transferase-like glycosyltransferase